MSLLRGLPFNLCQPGPEDVDGVGNYYLQVFFHEQPALNLYFLDSHGQIPSKVRDPDYRWITQSQINWFTCTAQALRNRLEVGNGSNYFNTSLAFMHIPLPEFGQSNLIIKGGQRREPTEGPSFNSHFYDILAREGIAAIGCGHDHVNDFCALLSQQTYESANPDQSRTTGAGPWLCYNGGSGFGGYCSYGENRYHRRTRVWEFDSKKGSLKTWKRVEYASERVDELTLVEKGTVTSTHNQLDRGLVDNSNQAVLK
jgi:hypothetical protein